MEQKPSEDIEKLFLEFREKLFLEQEVCLRKEKEKQVIFYYREKDLRIKRLIFFSLGNKLGDMYDGQNY